jgi:hypothetical protein
VSEEKDAGALAAGGAKTKFEDVAEVALFVALDGAVERGDPGGDEVVGAVYGGFVVGRGFYFDQLAEAAEEGGLIGLYCSLDGVDFHWDRVADSRQAYMRRLECF